MSSDVVIFMLMYDPLEKNTEPPSSSSSVFA